MLIVESLNFRCVYNFGGLLARSKIENQGKWSKTGKTNCRQDTDVPFVGSFGQQPILDVEYPAELNRDIGLYNI